MLRSGWALTSSSQFWWLVTSHLLLPLGLTLTHLLLNDVLALSQLLRQEIFWWWRLYAGNHTTSGTQQRNPEVPFNDILIAFLLFCSPPPWCWFMALHPVSQTESVWVVWDLKEKCWEGGQGGLVLSVYSLSVNTYNLCPSVWLFLTTVFSKSDYDTTQKPARNYIQPSSLSPHTHPHLLSISFVKSDDWRQNGTGWCWDWHCGFCLQGMTVMKVNILIGGPSGHLSFIQWMV